MLFPVIFRSQKKAGKSGRWLQKPENPPENPKNLTGKCPAARVFAVSGHFPLSEKGRKIRAVAAETGKSTGKSQKPDRKMPCSPRIFCFRSFSVLRKRPENPDGGCRNRKIHRKIPKPDRKMPCSPRICCFRSFSVVENGLKNGNPASGTGKYTEINGKPDQKMPYRPRNYCFR